MRKEDLPHLPKRNPLLLKLGVFLLGYPTDILAKIQVDFPPETKVVIKEKKIPKLYVGLQHKSMWETTGIPWVTYHYNKQLPYFAVGDNLFEGWLKKLVESTGVIYVKRQGGRSSAQDLSEKIAAVLTQGDDLLIFLQKGRIRPSGQKPLHRTAAQGALFASHFRDDVYFLPVTVDYEHIREEDELTGKYQQQTYTFKLHHLLSYVKPLGNVYVTFGKPLKVEPQYTRYAITAWAEEQLKAMKKILPINVVSEAAVRFFAEKKYTLEEYVQQVLEDVSSYKKQWRGFASKDPRELLEKYGPFSEEKIKQYQLYATYLQPLLRKE